VLVGGQFHDPHRQAAAHRAKYLKKCHNDAQNKPSAANQHIQPWPTRTGSGPQVQAIAKGNLRRKCQNVLHCAPAATAQRRHLCCGLREREVLTAGRG
jgi:hypothetical protein